MSTAIPWAKRVFDAKVAAERKLRPKRGESSREYRERVENAIAAEWGCAASTLRAFKNGSRRPKLETCPKFFDDLKRYGGAVIVDGKVDPDSLDKGPDFFEFIRTTPPGGNGRSATR